MIPVLAATANVVKPIDVLRLGPPSRALHFWLNPRAGHTKDGSDKVSRWTDSTYHTDQDAIETDSNFRPLWFVSGSAQNSTFISHSFLEFDGANDRLIALPATLITGSSHTFGLVYAQLTPNSVFDGFYAELNQFGNDFQSPGSFVVNVSAAGNNQRFEHNESINNFPILPQVANILIGTFDGNAGVVKLYVNNFTTPQLAISQSSGDFNVARIILAARSSAGGSPNFFSKCQISEVVIYGTALEGPSGSIRKDLFDYFTNSVSGTL